jgi:hypothetical protein
MTPERFKKIIELETGINVDVISRKRNFVEVRALYYKLLRDVLGMTLQSIADTVNKDHATVLHSINNFDIWSSYSEDLRTYYSNVMHMIHHYEYDSIDDLELSKLRYNNILLDLKVKELTNHISKMKKTNISRLHDLIDKIPEEKEELMFERISAIVRMNC